MAFRPCILIVFVFISQIIGEDSSNLHKLPNDRGEYLDSDFIHLYDQPRYIDKTLFIESLLSEGKLAVLITAPRRFGKSTLLSMLSYFFTIQINTENLEPLTPIESSPNYKMFQGLKIFQNKEIIKNYLGRHPVIIFDFVRFPVKIHSIEEGFDFARRAIRHTYRKHLYLLHSQKLSNEEKEAIREWARAEPKDPITRDSLVEGLHNLTYYLHKHFNAKCIVLVDEFDVPGMGALLNDDPKLYENITNLIAEILNNVLKTNTTYVERGVICGISYITAIGTSRLNNINIYQFPQNERYMDYIGVAEDEFQQLMKKYKVSTAMTKAAQQYYDGYSFGNKKIYCVHSIMKFISYLPKLPDNYWCKTEAFLNFRSMIEVDILSDMIQKLTFGSTAVITPLQRIKTADVRKVYKNVVDLEQGANSDNKFLLDLYSTLLLEQGYLKIIDKDEEKLTVKVPNTEIQITLQGEFRKFYTYTERFNHAVQEEIREILMELNFTNKHSLKISIGKYYLQLSLGINRFCEREPRPYLNEETFRFFMLNIMKQLAPFYNITPELNKTDIVMQRRNAREFIIIELTHGDDVNNGFFQILHNKYYEEYKNDHFIIMALNLRSDEKKFCKIDMMYQADKPDIHNVLKITMDKTNTSIKEKVTVDPNASGLRGCEGDSEAKKKLFEWRASNASITQQPITASKSNRQ